MSDAARRVAGRGGVRRFRAPRASERVATARAIARSPAPSGPLDGARGVAWVPSVPAQGAWVTTPRTSAPSRSVLLIEDDAPTRAALSELLAGEGLRVIASDEGRKALELAGFTRPALVVLDLAMEGMNGWEFLERRGEVPALSGVPVLVVTASAAETPVGTSVLRKPVEPGELLATIRRLLRAAAGARA